LPNGTPAPDFELSSIDDGRVSLRALRADRRWVLLTFIDPACGSCHALLPEIARAQAAAASGVVAVISRGSKDENRASAVEHDLNNVLLQNGDVSEQYRVPGTPSAVLIDSAGRLAGPVAAGLEPVRALLDRVQDGGSSQLLTVHSSAGSPSGVQIGEPLPDIRLRQLEGEERLISDAAGSDAIIVFWNQSCRFCQQMIDALRRHEREYAGTVVVISSSSVEQNRQIGIAGPVLCDPERQAMQAFAASGTPMAVRVSEGRVASRLVAGEEALLALFKGEPVGAHA
jgi:peroxiredoxin